MAVAPMYKVTVLGYRPVMDDIVSALQRAGVLEVDAVPYDLPAMDAAVDEERLRRLDEQTAEARFVVDFLGRYRKNEQPMATFVSEKFHVDADSYGELRFEARERALYRECVAAADRLASGERERARLVDLVSDLEPWVPLHTQIREWRNTDHTVLFTGTVPAREGGAIRQRLREEVSEVTVDELGPVGDRQAWVVIAHKDLLADVRSVLGATGFCEVRFDGLADSPAEEMARALERIAEIDAKAAEIDVHLRELAAERYSHAYALVQALESQRDRLTVRRDFGATERAFVISGWAPKSRSADLESALAPWKADVDVTLSEPTEEDSPPVELDNPRWLRPLEVLTDLYGRPQYREMDPTILLAPFFLAFFGICIGDVGYGLMLIVGCWLIKTRLDVAPGVKRFCTLMMYGGGAAMLFGVAFGSYLAIPIEQLPSAMTYETADGLRAYGQLLDPLGQLTDFLLFTIVLGAIHVFFGVIVAAYDAFRRNDPAEAVFGQLSTLLFFGSIAAMVLTGRGVFLSLGLVVTMLMQGRAIQAAFGGSGRPAWDRALGFLWLAVTAVSAVMMGTGLVAVGLGLLVATSIVGAVVSKTARAAVIGFLGGAYAVYGMSSFVGDVLSYTRLAALGLSGSLVGYVFNLLAGMVWDPAMALLSEGGLGIVWGVLIAVMAAAVFVVGHVFNVVINLLGAFVHPARLQFVEFFSKFYEGGGRPLAPFRFRAENLVLEAGAAGTEGGTGT